MEPKVYSYVRFSTAEQLQGDSRRRQTALAREHIQEYALKYGLEPADDRVYEDLGVSGFRGKNHTGGKLGEFLDRVQAGAIAPGSVLLVENLDRISRQAPHQAAMLLLRICALGVRVVTLTDRREYSNDQLDGDPFLFVYAVLGFIRAHEESATKARRVRAAWEGKREKLREKPLTAVCPAWLVLDKEAGEFRVIEERAEVVRRIYRDTLQGTGVDTITKALNEDGTPVFGRGKHWHSSYIVKILDNPAVIGRMTPHTLTYDGRGVRKRVPLDPVDHYYPAVVELDLFHDVQALRGEQKKRSAPRRGIHAGQEVRNLFGGLARCGRCGGTVTRVYKGKGMYGEYLACRSAKSGAGCKYETVSYKQVESFFLERAGAILANAPAGDGGGDLDRDLERVQSAIEGNTEAIGHILAEIEEGRRSPILTRRREELEIEAEALKADRREILERMEIASGPLVARRIENLEAALAAEPLDRTAANTLMRQVFDSVTVDYDTGQLLLAWKHGGETSAGVVLWPKEA